MSQQFTLILRTQWCSSCLRNTK